LADASPVECADLVALLITRRQPLCSKPARHLLNGALLFGEGKQSPAHGSSPRPNRLRTVILLRQALVLACRRRAVHASALISVPTAVRGPMFMSHRGYSPARSKCMAPRVDPVSSDESLPARVDVVLIGGGIIGTSTALFLAQRGIAVALCEKG